MKLFEQLHPSWQILLADYRDLVGEIENKLDRSNITPAFENIMAAYQLPPKEIKVVLFGQDPYPTPGVAHGLAFSVDSEGPVLPASLRNIFKELHDDCGDTLQSNGDLHRWSEQGVFLLNRVLTTTPKESLAHEGIGWEIFTEATAKILGELGVVGVFWGKKSFELAKYFDPHLVLSSPHPSPLSAYRGFFGSKPFSKVNMILKTQGKQRINW